MAELDDARERARPETAEMDLYENGTTTPKKRKRTRKVQSDRKFECTHEGCGKSYSRAEHLYRHQLNRMARFISILQFEGLVGDTNEVDSPKEIFQCDFPDCHRSFVRQDLCIRHRERHTTRGSQLQRRDYLTQPTDPTVSAGRSQMSPTGDSQLSPEDSPPTARALSTLHTASRHDSARQTSASSPPSAMTPFNYPAIRHNMDPSHAAFRPASSANQPVNSPEAWASPNLQKHPYIPFRHSTTSVHSGELGQDPAHPITSSNQSAQSSAMYPMSPVTGGSFAQSTPYDTQSAMQIPGYSDLNMAPATTSLDRGGMNGFDASDVMTAGTMGDIGFDPISSCAYPIFGGETYNRSPFAMADDFAAWLFNESASATSPLGYPSVPGMIPNYMDPGQLHQNRFYIQDAGYGNFFTNVIPHHPMSVTSILDPGSPQAIMSEDKRQELLHLMSTRFNESAYSSVSKRKDALMDGDIDDDSHVLSLRMMETYIGSYWYHFHAQLPILHQPTFSADKAPNLLLLAVMAIGAATLDKIHGKEITEMAAELSNFIAWHLRWEIFMDADFRPPAKLWVFQGLLLLEVYEKVLSTRAMHERAHIHHDTTLTLMRRGSSLIGRSSLDSPGSHQDRPARSTGSVAASDVVADESWSHWIKAEATRRVAFAAFVLDSTHATMFGHSAKMVAHELRLPLPCDEGLWSATSAGEVARVQSSLQANGLKPTMFLDGLKRTLNGQGVRTNAFGRTVLMAGLLSVSWHMNQRDLQVSSLGVPQALGGRDKWRSALLRSFDNWRRDFDEAVGQSRPTSSNRYWTRHPLGEDNLLESRDVLHGLAHMASHVDFVDCQILAGARRLMGRSITPRDYTTAQEKMTERWATKASARDATFYALKILSDCLLLDHHNPPEEGDGGYSARDDYLFNRPWVLYTAALVVWCYGYALEGSISPPMDLSTPEARHRDMQSFLRRVGGVREPNELEGMKGRNRCLGLLMVLRENLEHTRWELLDEAAMLLGNCIEKLRGDVSG